MLSFKQYLKESLGFNSKDANTWWKEFGFIAPDGKIISGNAYNKGKSSNDSEYATDHDKLARAFHLESDILAELKGYIRFGFGLAADNTIDEVMFVLNLQNQKNKTLTNLENFIAIHSSIIKRAKVLAFSVFWGKPFQGEIDKDFSKIYQLTDYIDYLKKISLKDFKAEVEKLKNKPIRIWTNLK